MGIFLFSTVTIIVSTIIYALTLRLREYGPIEGIFPLGVSEIPVRTKLKNWRELVGNINFILVARSFKEFITDNKQYRAPILLSSIDLVLTNKSYTKSIFTSYREFCYNELRYMYVIKIDILRVHKEKMRSDEFADMLIREYKKLHLEYCDKCKQSGTK